MCQPRRSPGASGPKPGLRWCSRWAPEDGGGCSGRRCHRTLAETLAQAYAQTCREEDEGDYEGGSSDVETKGGSAVSAAQLGEVLEVG
jgi:hypothetical protein